MKSQAAARHLLKAQKGIYGSMGFKTISFVFIGLLIFTAPQASIARHWYVGGDLYQATAWQWQNSSYENRLATAANWALMQPSIRKVSRKSSSMETVKPYAIELVACIDRVSAGEDYKEEKVSSLAAACMASMGW